MAITTDDLNSFHHFALAAIAGGDASSLQQLVDRWEAEHPPADLHMQNVAAIQAAIRDMEDGDAGRPAQHVIAEMRAELSARHAT